LRIVTPADDRYSGVDYSYTSSNSNFSKTHWEKYAKDVSEKAQLKQQETIIDIGSNDGYLPKQFKELGFNVLGVDPSEYMANLAKKLNVETIVGLFDSRVANKIVSERGKVKLIVANNVFNHSNDPLDFAKAVVSLLETNGTFVFELPYWYEGFKTGKFDQIYHEHVSYFTAKSSAILMEKVGMSIERLEVVDYHGGSLRVYAKKKEDLAEHSKEVDEFIFKEESLGLFDVDVYKKFMSETFKKRDDFLKKVYNLKSQGKSIIAVGAAAKGNTFLNFYNLDHNVIDYVTDSSPHKRGKFTPLTRIPIEGDEVFEKYGEVYALILSWNIAHILKPILYKINPNIQFIVPD
jgi:SAM-dependent methyltransferase